jgi:hypothetical protein
VGLEGVGVLRTIMDSDTCQKGGPFKDYVGLVAWQHAAAALGWPVACCMLRQLLLAGSPPDHP